MRSSGICAGVGIALVMGATLGCGQSDARVPPDAAPVPANAPTGERADLEVDGDEPADPDAGPAGADSAPISAGVEETPDPTTTPPDGSGLDDSSRGRRADSFAALDDGAPGPVVGPSVLDVAYVEAAADEEARIDRFIREKVIHGWATRRTPHYLIVFDEDVDRKRVILRVAAESEALRTQLLEPLFPPVRRLAAITNVRICESRTQFQVYGAPSGSAGYWSPYHREVVLYQDRNDKKDLIRVMKSMVCVAYLHDALNGATSHPWFSEGHGDYFAGHVYTNGKLQREPFAWRIETARAFKSQWAAGVDRVRDGETGVAQSEHLGLEEWLGWDAAQFHGRNDWDIPASVNYALAWSFVYFLRSSDDPAHARFLTRYYETLRELAGARIDAQEREAQDDATAATRELPDPASWPRLALARALDGVEIAELEQAWLAHTVK